ncbi:MAG: cobyric acid synthase [Oscillospiraceae bacterium]
MAKAIMIQGTMSNAGKSIIVTALCRIFKQDGYTVAPFKSQNMALNSYITDDGLEMGRAQVVQAEAAGVKPSVLMNPILLKPTTDVGSQVILKGEIYGNMAASEYFAHKKELVPHVLDAYNTLASQYDIIVIEGAGSPAEINLKSEDIVNMGMAKMAKAPVLLVGDIDRGGVFAQLYGTMGLLEEDERKMVKGLIVNKFRGDEKILRPGLDMLREKIKDFAQIDMIGVVPYVHMDIEDEDSLSDRLASTTLSKAIDIAVVKLPKVANFTDFNALSRFENVSLRYVTSPSELHTPDMIILPGTKSTIADLLWLRQNGLEAEILKCHSKGTVVFGVCGGFQMLGEKLCDPYNVEGGGKTNGLGLLPITTVFEKEKKRIQTSGKIEGLTGIFQGLNGLDYTGYEIHMGKTQSGFDGQIVSDNNTYGTYIHGIFDEGEISQEVINSLCRKKGIPLENIDKFDIREYKEQQYDKLAQAVRSSLDMEEIYRILNSGI